MDFIDFSSEEPSSNKIIIRRFDKNKKYFIPFLPTNTTHNKKLYSTNKTHKQHKEPSPASLRVGSLLCTRHMMCRCSLLLGTSHLVLKVRSWGCWDSTIYCIGTVFGYKSCGVLYLLCFLQCLFSIFVKMYLFD